MADIVAIEGVIPPKCPKCGRTAMTVRTQYGPRHQCCGMHSWRGKPLVDKETHDLRREAHAAIDPLWQSGKMRRSFVYQTLARLMRITGEECHIAQMNPVELRLVIELAPEVAAVEDIKLNTRRPGPPQPKCDCGKLSSPKRLARYGDRRCRACIREAEALELSGALATSSKDRVASGS